MKTASKVFALLFTLCSQFSFAQMDNLGNMSAEWIRTGARNAATDATDIMLYNPAGLTKLSNGFHMNLSNQSLFRHPSHSYDLGLGQGMKSFSQSGADPFLPNMYAVYKQKDWAFYSGIFNVGGGATMNYPTGSLTTDLIGLQVLQGAGGAYMDVYKQHLKASSMYLTTTLGATYAFDPKISFSYSIRYISAKNTTDAGMTLTSSPFDFPDQDMVLKTEESASGFGGVLAMNVTPSDRFNFSMRYESSVKLDFRTRKITDDFGMTTDGEKNRRDLPAVMAIGCAYVMNSKLTAYADYNYYFQKNAAWGKSSTVTNEKTWSEMAGNAATYALAFQYKVNPKLMASMGGGYTKYMYSDKPGYYTKGGTFEVMQDNNCNLNTGLAFKVSEKFNVNAGYMHTFWAKDQKIKALNAQPLDVDVTVNNSLDALAIGFDLTF